MSERVSRRPGLAPLLFLGMVLPACRQALVETPSAAPARPATLPLPASPVDDFALFTADGGFARLSEQTDVHAVALVAFAEDSTAVRRDATELERLKARLAPGEARVFWIDSAPERSRETTRRAAGALGTTLPVLMDDLGLVRSALGTERAGEVLLVATDGMRAVYRGSVAGLAAALDDLLAGAPVAEPTTPLDGEPLPHDPRDAAPVPEYAADIAPILAERCLPCHRPGGIAPWSMSSFDEVRGWSAMIRETVRARRMPPWHADPAVGRFRNDGGLAPEEARALVRWTEAGAPRGSGEDPLPARAAAEPPEWPLGPPDFLFDPPAFEVPATGDLPYVYGKLVFDFPRDVWLCGVDVRPTNLAVVHHVQVTVTYPERMAHLQPVWDDEAGFAVYAPGQTPALYPEGAGRFLPAGSTLLFELHLTTTGRPETCAVRTALYFLDAPPSIELETPAASSWDFVVPAGEPCFVQRAERRFEHDTVLHEILPHMHYRGRSMAVEALYPNGERDLLLSVPDYDFDWQRYYTFDEPPRLPAGTVVRCTAVFDNSARNPSNPDPGVDVAAGRRTVDEMLIGFMLTHRATHPAKDRATDRGASED